MRPIFRFHLSYMGCVDYMVTDETGTYRATMRHSAGDYELSIANGDAVRRDILASVGMIYRSAASAPISAATVAAFNAWRAAEHDAFLAHCKANAPKYDCLPATDSIWQAPAEIRGGRYVTGQGWQPIDAAAELGAAA